MHPGGDSGHCLASPLSGELMYQGAEARLYRCQLYSSSHRPRQCIVKERFVKSYRHPALDKSLSLQRLRAEVRILLHCRRLGLDVPPIFQIDLPSRRIWLGFIGPSAVTLLQHFDQLTAQLRSSVHTASDTARSVVKKHISLHLKQLTVALGRLLARLHANHVIHGDLTMANILVHQVQPEEESEEFPPRLALIDFGLASLVSHTSSQRLPEEKAVDLFVFERALINAVDHNFLTELSDVFPKIQTPEGLMQCILNTYLEHYFSEATSLRNEDEENKEKKKKSNCSVSFPNGFSEAALVAEAKMNLSRLDEVRLRGRKRLMIG